MTVITEIVEACDVRAFALPQAAGGVLPMVELRFTTRTNPNDPTSLTQYPNFQMSSQAALMFAQNVQQAVAQLHSRLVPAPKA